ncbi:MAG: single-stranded-DNA-specific exonuclease RecJ [Rhodospirillaceae bacterium]|jgi:single-stranded-DNA-specific exonuclease|nr:single-stranded-DNA-specific exonuclease RecJ [Rhodospirillaceae bacterium]|tara:strand:+ start:4182 stop:6011 length:1830 start_codon:yes stop_codon:yes gene_type:complete
MTSSAGPPRPEPPESQAGAGGPDCFLGVEKSLTGKRWISREADKRQSLALAQRLSVPEIVGRVLAARGVGLEDADVFLRPTLKGLLPDPSRLKGMDTAAERLARAVMDGHGIGIFGDYDVDGATSSALLTRFITAAGGRSATYIPDRLKEGYGPNIKALLRLQEGGATVIVTVDCGTSAHEPLTAAADAGLDVIVVDHHEAEAKLPPATAVINPNRLDDDSGQGQLAAVGVAFLLVVAVNRTLRDAGWYRDRPEPDLTQWLDLVALGTVCDVVPLTGLNRALVTQGLKVMAARNNTGLRALSDVAGLKEPPGTYHAGFLLGPRINAGGRIGESDLGSRLLGTDDIGEATDIAHRLDEFNRERRAIEAAVLDAAMGEAKKAGDDLGPLILVAGEGWHPGVIGIVAGRLAERFNRPACVVALDGKQATGSGRSVSGVDLGAAVIAACQAGVLIKGGGHKMAAGFTVESGRVGELREFLGDRISAHLGDGGIRPRLYLDGAMKPAAATMNLVDDLQQVGPFGSGNPEPRFVIPAARLSYAAVAGENHVRGTLTGEEGGRLAAISFNSLDTPLGQALLKSDGAPLHVAGRLRVNTWQGHSKAQLLIDDAAPAW